MQTILQGLFAANVPASGEIEGRAVLAIEQEHENLLDSPGDFTQADWTKVQMTIDPALIAGPNGIGLSDQLVDSVAGTTHYAEQSFAVDGASKYTMYAIAKADDYEWIYLSADFSDGSGITTAYFHLAGPGGDVGETANTEEDGTLSIGDGYYLCWMTKPSISGSTAVLRIHLAEDDGVISFAGSGTFGAYVYHAQAVAIGYPMSPGDGITAEDHLYWTAGDYSESILSNKFAFLMVPNYDHTGNSGARVFLFDDTASGYRVKMSKTASGEFTIQKYDGGWTVLVVVTGMTWSAYQILQIVIDPQKGTLEIQRATTGGAEVSGDRWDEFIPDTADLHWGSSSAPAFHFDGILSEPWLAT